MTRPLSYARHKNSGRVLVTIVTTWIISVSVSSPIVLGINYTERRREHPTLCTFYNSDFLIFSSMASFYVPCVIMTVLYGRIFRQILRISWPKGVGSQEAECDARSIVFRCLMKSRVGKPNIQLDPRISWPKGARTIHTGVRELN